MIMESRRSFGLLLTIVATFAIAPLIAIMYYTFVRDGIVDVSQFSSMFANERLWQTLGNSLLLGVLVILGTTILAFPMAFIRTKTTLQKYDWLDIVLTIPFMTPPYIGSMGWILFMQNNGFLQQLVPGTAWLSDAFFSLFGMVMVMSLHLFPFLYLMLKNTLLRINGSFLDAALIFGRSSLRNWLQVILPLLISSYGLGILLIFIKTLAEFGTPATFGSRIGFQVFTTEIHAYLSRWPVDIRMATSLSVFLLSVCLIIWYFQNLIGRKFTYSVLSGKTPAARERKDKWFIQLGSWFYVGFVLLFAIGIPYFSIIVTSLQKVRGDGLRAGNFTLASYQAVFTSGSAGLTAFLNSVVFSILTAVITAIIGLFIALYIKKGETKKQQLLDFFSLMPNIIPGIVFVVGLIMFWNAPWLPATIYNTKAMVVVTYCVLFLPYAVQYTKSSLSQLDQSIFQSAAIFGRNSWDVYRAIIIPLLMQGILAGMMMTFIISMRELVAGLLILPPSVETGATFIYSQFEQGNVGIGMAVAVITVGMTVVFMFLLNWLQRWGGHVRA
ncbi:ABC transporter permease [Lysinibacillus sphaericus]|uniref:Putative 2-aminoethylphosphonate transport system permease protein PhnV n=1 Tax=Lysinibacillus sphaericus TaxID=1421 RepID=A0A2S5D2H7_LYSSH|nr:iron ABC transporter permease [Lysinibacillus sphaericus]OEC01959.1 ABC transporter permease [Lysinibacillus sphaericus]POZ57285.1 putative 2-aminoethylphosphonate transport system permease protein PhnV [Lysinibacillus sphaericus]